MLDSNITNFVDLLRFRATEHPDRIAYIFLEDGETESDRLTYAQLDRKAAEIADYLLNSGAKPGDRALLLYPAGLDFITGFFRLSLRRHHRRSCLSAPPQPKPRQIAGDRARLPSYPRPHHPKSHHRHPDNLGTRPPLLIPNLVPHRQPPPSSIPFFPSLPHSLRHCLPSIHIRLYWHPKRRHGLP